MSPSKLLSEHQLYSANVPPKTLTQHHDTLRRKNRVLTPKGAPLSPVLSEGEAVSGSDEGAQAGAPGVMGRQPRRTRECVSVL